MSMFEETWNAEFMRSFRLELLNLNPELIVRNVLTPGVRTCNLIGCGNCPVERVPCNGIIDKYHMKKLIEKEYPELLL